MIADVIAFLKTRLEETGLFPVIYPIAEIKRTIQEGKLKSFPAAILSIGNYKNIEYDTSGGMSYFRRNGTVMMNSLKASELPLVIQTSCNSKDIYYRAVYPMKQVCFIPKEKAACVDGFEDDSFALRIIAAASEKNILVQNAVSAHALVERYECDRLRVLQSEYSNANEINDLNYNYSYISIDWNIEIIAKNECFDPCPNPYNQ